MLGTRLAPPLYHVHRLGDFERVADLAQEGGVVGLVAVGEGGLKRGDVDGVADGEVHGGVDHVAEGLLVVLNGATLAVVVTEEDELVLLAGPQRSHTLAVELQECDGTENGNVKWGN